MKSIRLFTALMFITGLVLAVRAAPIAHAGIIQVGMINERVASPAYAATTGSITIVKEAPLADPKHEFRFIELDTSEFSLTPGSSKDFPNLTPGNYAFAEIQRSSPEALWILTSVVCQDEEGEQFYPSMFDGGDVYYFIGATIPVEAGQHITCVFTNEPMSTLTIVKEAPLADPDHEFQFYVHPEPAWYLYPGEFVVTPGSHEDMRLVPPGFYGVVEDARSFPDTYGGQWTLTGVVCQDEQGQEY